MSEWVGETRGRGALFGSAVTGGMTVMAVKGGRGANLLAEAAEVGGELHHILDEVARGRGAHPDAPDLPHDAPQAVDEPPLRLLGPRRAGGRILWRQEGGAVDEVPASAATRGLA